MYLESTHLKSTTSQRSKQAKLIVRLIPLESFELIGIYLKKCVQKGLKKCDYTICMDLNKKNHITTLPKRDLRTRSYDMNMKKEGHITTLPKRALKTRSYNMDMNKKDLKRLSKSQLIKLLIRQEANEFENSIVSPPNQEESVPHKSVNDYEDIVLPPPEQV